MWKIEMINRSLGNFSEYALKSSLFVSQCHSPKFLILPPISYYQRLVGGRLKTFLNTNIMFNKLKMLPSDSKWKDLNT